MNFLAHLYLSFEDPEIQIGNFIADQIKGKKTYAFTSGIQKGIQLHRAIDDFTDSHPIYKRSCKRIFKDQGHYSRVVIDIFYDHFLASLWETYSSVPLEEFSQQFYTLIDSRKNELPERTQYLLKYMIPNDWLGMYRSLEGLERIFKGMHHRSNYNSRMDASVILLKEQYEDFLNDFQLFFPELIKFTITKTPLL